MMSFKKSLVSNGSPKKELGGEEMPMGEGMVESTGPSGDLESRIEELKADFNQKLMNLKAEFGGGEQNDEKPEMPMDEKSPEGEPAGEIGEPGMTNKKMPGLMISLGLGGKK
jgi:hypothetical protein